MNAEIFNILSFSFFLSAKVGMGGFLSRYPGFIFGIPHLHYMGGVFLGYVFRLIVICFSRFIIYTPQ